MVKDKLYFLQDNRKLKLKGSPSTPPGWGYSKCSNEFELTICKL